MPATAQGSVAANPEGLAWACGAGAPTVVPQPWQNLEPGVSGSPHPAQAAPLRGVPHSVQKRPVPGVLHLGHGVASWGADEVMGGKIL